MTIAREQVSMPELLPVPAEPLKTWKTRLNALFPKFTPNSRVEIDSHLVAVRTYAAWAEGFWKTQGEIATLRIREQLRDGEFGTVGGVDVVQRHRYPVDGHYVTPGDRDYLKSVKA
jgi:hypothetical protein